MKYVRSYSPDTDKWCVSFSVPAVTCPVMCRLRNTGSFGSRRTQRCWIDSRFTFLRQFMTLFDGISYNFYVKVDSTRC